MGKTKGQKKEIPIVTYVDSVSDGKSISFPIGWDLPLQPSLTKYVFVSHSRQLDYLEKEIYQYIQNKFYFLMS